LTFTENQGLKLRRGTKGLFSNVVVSSWSTGIDVEHDESLNAIGTGLKVTGINFIDITTKTKGKKTAVAPASTGVSADASLIVASELPTATGAGNGVSAPSWSTGWSVGL
jgi:hypothetical protein